MLNPSLASLQPWGAAAPNLMQLFHAPTTGARDDFRGRVCSQLQASGPSSSGHVAAVPHVLVPGTGGECEDFASSCQTHRWFGNLSLSLHTNTIFHVHKLRAYCHASGRWPHISSTSEVLLSPWKKQNVPDSCQGRSLTMPCRGCMQLSLTKCHLNLCNAGCVRTSDISPAHAQANHVYKKTLLLDKATTGWIYIYNMYIRSLLHLAQRCSFGKAAHLLQNLASIRLQFVLISMSTAISSIMMDVSFIMDFRLYGPEFRIQGS